MKKFLAACAAAVALCLSASAQQQPTSSLWVANAATVGQMFKLLGFSSGIPVYGPSSLADNGSQLLYKGQPVGGSSLPTATAAGQAPVSSAAGTTYTPQAVATLDGNGKVSAAQLSPAAVTVVVAASNSPNKQYANLVATGTADQTTIQQALSMCQSGNTGVPGCKVALMPGIYNLTASVNTLTDDVEIYGLSSCMWGGYNHVWDGSTPAGAIGLGCAQLHASSPSITLLNISAATPCGTGSGDNTRCRGISIHDLYFTGNTTSGTAYTGTGIGGGGDADNISIHDNILQRLATPINVAADTPNIYNNSIQDNLGPAITATSVGAFSRIHHNLIFDNGGLAISAAAHGGTVNDNVIGDSYGGVSVTGDHTTVANNQLAGISGSFVNLNSCRGCVVTGNAFNNQDPNVGFVGTAYLNASSSGISCAPGASGEVVSDNAFDTNIPMASAAYAVDLTNCANSTATGNTVGGGWNFGGSAIQSGTNSQIGTNANSFVAGSGPAAVTSALLMGQFTASSLGLADGATVTTWPDTSGFGNTFTGHGTPIYKASSLVNSKPAVRFSATTAYFSGNFYYGRGSSGTANLGSTYFVVFNYTTAAISGNVTSIINGGNLADTVYVDSSSRLGVYNGTTVLVGPTLVPGMTYVIEATFAAGNAGTARVSVNGTVYNVSGAGTGNQYVAQYLPGSGVSGTQTSGAIDVAAYYYYWQAMSSSDAAAVGAVLTNSSNANVTNGGAW